jgi:hypothetical protein
MGGGQSLSATIEVINNIFQKTVTTVLNRTSIKISNIIHNSQYLSIHVDQNAVFDCGKGIDINQLITTDSKVNTQITAQTSSDIKSALQSELKNSASQTNDAIQGFLAGLGTTGQNLNTKAAITNTLNQAIENNVTTEHLSDIMNATISIQNLQIYVGKGAVFKADTCNLQQDIQSSMIATNVVNDIMSTFTNSASLNRIENDIAQANSAKQVGLEGLLDALMKLAWPLAFVAVAFLATGGTIAVKGVSSLTDYRFIAFMAAILGVYLLLAYYLKWPPFRIAPRPESWDCEKDGSGKFTGKCQQLNDASGTYATQTACQAAIASGKACQSFFGCGKDANGNYTGKCAQYDNPAQGPYPTEGECNNAIANKRDCLFTYKCSAKDFSCYKFDGPDNYQTMEDCKNSCVGNT